MSAIVPGDTVTRQPEGRLWLTLTSEPEGLAYTAKDNTVTFTMPSYDVKAILEGVRYYQAFFLYNYGDLDVYEVAEVKEILPSPDPPIPTSAV